MKIKIDGVEVEVGSAAEAAELLAELRKHARGSVEAAPAPRRGRPPKLLQLVPLAALTPPAPALAPTLLHDVDVAQIDWLWRHRIPAGMLTVLYADPGAGKGTLAAMLVAAVTAGGALPDDDRDRQGASVLYVVAEDNPALTLRPRLEAVGARVDRVHVFGPELRLRLPDHAANIESAVKAAGARLIVIDPLRGVMDGDSRPKVRKALVALEDIAARTGAAVLLIHHTNRQGSLHGSQDIIGIPRSVLRVDVSRGVQSVVPEKKNLAPDVEPIYFKIVSRGSVGAVEWVDAPGEVDVEVDAPEEERAAADQVLAELQLEVERPALEGGVMWDAGAGEPAIVLDDVAELLQVSARSLRVRIRRGTAAALVACAETVEGTRYWARSAVAALVERGLEVVGKRLPGPPEGTGATPEEEKMPEAAVRELLVKNAGSIARAAESIGLARIVLRRRVSELALDDYARELQEAAGRPRFRQIPRPEEAPESEEVELDEDERRRPRRRKKSKIKILNRCRCCSRPIGTLYKVCPHCDKCAEVDGSWQSRGTCPRALTSQLRPVTPAQVEADRRALVKKKPPKEQDRVAHNHRPKTEAF